MDSVQMCAYVRVLQICVCERKVDGKTNTVNVNTLYLFAAFLKPEIM